MDEETRGLFTLETICKTGIRFDRRSVVGYCLEKSPWLKAGKVERDNAPGLAPDQLDEDWASVPPQPTARAR